MSEHGRYDNFSECLDGALRTALILKDAAQAAPPIYDDQAFEWTVKTCIAYWVGMDDEQRADWLSSLLEVSGAAQTDLVARSEEVRAFAARLEQAIDETYGA